MKSTIDKPWGFYQIIEEATDYIVKKLFIKADQETSLQSHNHRSEHWIVVNGFAEITINNATKTLKTNESIYIPSATKHRIANRGTDALVIIEVWYGKKLDENDIIRYEDKYNRVTK